MHGAHHLIHRYRFQTQFHLLGIITRHSAQFRIHLLHLSFRFYNLLVKHIQLLLGDRQLQLTVCEFLPHFLQLLLRLCQFTVQTRLICIRLIVFTEQLITLSGQFLLTRREVRYHSGEGFQLTLSSCRLLTDFIQRHLAVINLPLQFIKFLSQLTAVLFW